MPAVFLRRSEVLRRLGMGDTAFRTLIAEGYLPDGVQVTPGGRAVAWLESEIENYIKRRVALRHAPEKESKPPVPTRKQRDGLQPAE